MKGNGKLFFMVLVLFAILTMGSVNAADNVMETNISADTSTNNNIMLNTYTNEVWISNDGSDSNSGSESNPYKTLNKGIWSVDDDSCIHLKEGTYTGVNNRDLVVSKNLTFIGAGADKTIIDAQKQGRIFNINGYNTITLINLTLTNGHVRGHGGAIYTEDGDVIVSGGVSFVNNSATGSGGAICTIGNVSVSGVNVSFVNNSVNSGHGGAIYATSGVIVYGVNVSFVNNSAANYGGAIYSYGDVIVSGVNVSFVNNSAANYGGVIYAGNGVSVSGGVSFVNNRGSSIVQVSKNIMLSNCNFISNNATQSVVIVDEYGDGFLNMSYCIFINNNGDFISCLNLSDNNVDYNYWGSNDDPNSKLTNATAKTWIVLIPTINSNNVVAGDSVDLIVEFMSTTDGKTFTKLNKSMSNLPINITANIGGVNPENTVIKDNVAKTNYTANAAGVETVKINFGKTTLTNLTFNVKKSSNININVDDIVYGEDLTVNVSVTPGATGNVTVTVNNKTKTVTLRDGKASVVFAGLGAGNYTVNVMYSGDGNYTGSTNTTSFEVVKADSSVNISVDDIVYGSDLTVDVSVTPGATGDVTVTVNGVSKTVSLRDGKASVVFAGLGAGDYTVNVMYSGDDNYNSCRADASFVVSKVSDYNMTVSMGEIIVGEKAMITVYLPDDATGDVTIEINNQKYTQKITNGKAQFTINPLEEGTYNMTVTYEGDNNYDLLSRNLNVTVSTGKRVNLDVSDVIMFYKDGTRFVAVLTDSKNNPIANAVIYFTINGITYNRTTDAKGYASMALNLMPGVYNASVYYKGSDNYDSASKNVTVTIKSTIDGQNIVKFYQNGTQFFATFIDTHGNILANTNVTFNINGVFYTRKTNNDGTARLTINLRPGEYILTALNPNSTEQKGFYVTVKSLIEANDLTKYYQNASRFEAKIYNKDGSLATNTKVTFNINGVFYTRTTNDKGVVSLAINLRPGTYTITTMYNGLSMGNTVKVLSTLETKDLSMKFRDGSKFQAKTVDGQGNPLANQNITFNVNGVFYHKTTDENGVASLNINLNPGVYIITSIWNNYQVGNKITIA